MPPVVAGIRASLDRRALVTSLVVSTVPISVLLIAAGYPALQDFGGWLYQGHVLTWVWSGASTQFAFAPHPVPYALAQYGLGMLNLLLPPMAAGTVYVLLYALLGAVAVSAFVRRYELRAVAAASFLTVSVVLGSGLWNGYVGTQLGVILLTLFLALDRRLTTSLAGVALSGLVMMLTHAITFAVWGLIALIFAIAARRVWQFLVGVIPAVLLFGWYAVASREADTGVVAPEGAASFLAFKAYTLAKFGGYQNFVMRGMGDSSAAPALYVAGITLNVLLVGLLLLAIVQFVITDRRMIRRHRPEAISLAALAAIAFATPQFGFGIVNPGERIAAPALVLVALFLFAAERRTRFLPLLVCAVMVAGLGLATISAGLVVLKRNAGTTSPVDDTASRVSSLFAHRTDEMEASVEAARKSADEDSAPDFPLVWETSVLLEVDGAELQPWRNPYLDVPSDAVTDESRTGG